MVFNKTTAIKKTAYILFISIAAISSAYSQTSRYVGNWKGYLLTDTSNIDNKKGLPVTIFFSADNETGDLAGEMTIQYRYQDDIYKAKYTVSGLYDASGTVFIQQEKLVYYDLLPKGLIWCFGSGYFNVFRDPYRKKNYLDGNMTTNCGDEELRMILVKK